MTTRIPQKIRFGLFISSFLAIGFTIYVGVQGIVNIEKLSWIGKSNIINVVAAILVVMAFIFLIDMLLLKFQEKKLYGAPYSKKSVTLDIFKGLVLPVVMIVSGAILINFSKTMNAGINDLILKISTLSEIVKVPEMVASFEKIHLIKTALNPRQLGLIISDIRETLEKIREYSNILKTVENTQDIKKINQFIDQLKDGLDKVENTNNNIKLITTIAFVAAAAFFLYQVLNFVKNFMEAKYKDENECKVGVNISINNGFFDNVWKAFSPSSY